MTGLFAPAGKKQRMIVSQRIAGNENAGGEYLSGDVQALLESLGEIHAGIRTLNSARVCGAIPKVIVNGQSIKLATMPGRIAGWSIRETTGTTSALVKILDGPDQYGDVIAPINLAANDSIRDWFMPAGIAFANGLYVSVVSGSIEGAVYLAQQGQ